jgi:hypothetical protein
MIISSVSPEIFLACMLERGVRSPLDRSIGQIIVEERNCDFGQCTDMTTHCLT